MCSYKNFYMEAKLQDVDFYLRGHPQTTWFSNWDFLTPPPPYVATFQIADVVFSRTFLDPPSPPEVATWFVDDPLS